jgi:hypothetical protein
MMLADALCNYKNCKPSLKPYEIALRVWHTHFPVYLRTKILPNIDGDHLVVIHYLNSLQIIFEDVKLTHTHIKLKV